MEALEKLLTFITVKELVDILAKYAYFLSCRELHEKIDSTLMSVQQS